MGRMPAQGRWGFGLAVLIAGTLSAGQEAPPQPDAFFIQDDLSVRGSACIGAACANGGPGIYGSAVGIYDSVRSPFSQASLHLVTDSDSTVGWTRTWRLTTSGVSASNPATSLRLYGPYWPGSSGWPNLWIDEAAATTLRFTGSNLLITDVFASSSASAAVHIKRGGDAKLLVQNSNAPTLGRNMLHFINSGASTFKFQNTSDDTEWNFGSRNAGDFFIAFGPGVPLEYVFDPNGNLTIAGTLTQNSDRHTKTDVEPVDGRALLDKLAVLPVSTWRFKADPPSVRHMGPMAQDFAAAFGLGPDERHIAPVDVGGVSLAAIQALTRENAALRSDLEALRARLSAIEASQAGLRR